MADDKRADNGKRAEKIEDMAPVPTQAQLDQLKAGEGQKVEKRETKPAEDMTPTPTQAENDEIKAKLFNTTVEEDKKRREEYVAAHTPGVKASPEEMVPTPTQKELDDTKRGIMYDPEDNPGTGTDPQKPDAPAQQRRTLDAGRPGSYQTRAAEPTKAE